MLPGVVNVRTAGFDGGKGEGSGVVIDRRGIILTNNHVVRGARTLTVSFNDGRHTKPVTGSVVGTAAERDLAIIRVQLNDLIPVPLGRSSKLRLGDGVLAIGFPLDLGGGPTVTQGIVSGLDRTVHADGGPDLEGLLQTDAAINPGNSGGALVDSAGRLIGINTVAAQGRRERRLRDLDRRGASRDRARSAASRPTSARGSASRSTPSTRRRPRCRSASRPTTRGAAVTAVFADSPGSKAGLREGDVVVAIDGRPVRSASAFARALSALDPGASVTLDVVDQAGPRRVTVTVAKRPATLPGG